MTLDLPVHTAFSGPTTICPLSVIMKESCNIPEGVYRRARSRGMDLVTITDHGLCLPLAGALAHVILEERFNQALLFDLVERSATTQVREAA